MYQKISQALIPKKEMRHRITLNLEQISLMKIPKDHGYYMYIHPQREWRFTWFSNLETKMVEDKKNGKENKHNLSLGSRHSLTSPVKSITQTHIFPFLKTLLPFPHLLPDSCSKKQTKISLFLSPVADLLLSFMD